MKKSYLTLLKLGVFLAVGLSQAHADPIDDFLTDVDRAFTAASTPARKYEIVSQPINLSYLRSLKSIKELNEEELRKDVGKDPLVCDTPSGKKINYHKTTPFSLALAVGKLDLVRKFLPVIPDVNAPELTSWGYRQPYTPAHVVLDPQYPSASQEVFLEYRLMIVDALGECGADFNAIISPSIIGAYGNPPLAAGEPEGGHPKLMTQLRAVGLLYGADPARTGSCWWGLNLEEELLLGDFALPYYMARVQAGIKLRPTEKVMAWLKGLAAKKGFDLNEVSQKVEEKAERKHVAVEEKKGAVAESAEQQYTPAEDLKSQKPKSAHRKKGYSQPAINVEEITAQLKSLAAQIKKNEALLEVFKGQKTKNAKSKQSHHGMVLRDLQFKVKALNRKLLKSQP